jgi:hypothetical protein
VGFVTTIVELADHPGRRAVALLAGAGLVAATIGTGRISFGQVPLVVGLCYLVASYAGGSGGRLWETACVVTGWGIGNAALYADSLRDLQLPESAAHMTGMGLGVLFLAYLAKVRGVQWSLLGVAAAMIVSGVVFELQRGQRVEVFNHAKAYVVLLAAYAATDLIRWVRTRE